MNWIDSDWLECKYQTPIYLSNLRYRPKLNHGVKNLYGRKKFLKTYNFFASYYTYCVAVYPAVNGLISFHVVKDHEEASIQFRRATPS